MGTHFFWDPVEDNIIQERDDTGAITADYTTEPYLFGDLISQRRSGQSRFHCFDGQGSTRALTDSSANVTDIYAYTAFGEVCEHMGATISPHRYVARYGYQWSGQVPEYLVRRRRVTPCYGRWLSADPLQALLIDLGRDDLALTPYVYTYNNSPNSVDPSGMIPLRLVFGAFIPQRLGHKVDGNPKSRLRWGIEPGFNWSPFNNYGMFGTDDRNDAGEPGTFRMRSVVTVDTDDIGRLECSTVSGTNIVGESHRIVAHIAWNVPNQRRQYTYAPGSLQSKTAPLTVDIISPDDISCCHSTITIKASAGYPFALVAPHIDYAVVWDLRRVDCGFYIRVTLSGSHDLFPAYEGFIEVDGLTHVVYEYRPDPPYTGPTLGNLGGSSVSAAGRDTFCAPKIGGRWGCP